MDLTIQLEKVVLNIRVAVLLKTNNGFLFEKGSQGHLFVLGGRVKANETSLEAAHREVLEEVGYNLMPNVKLVAVVENFFSRADSAVHEICFVYSQEEGVEIEVPNNFVEIPESELENQDIRPEIIKQIIADSRGEISHHLVKG